MVSEASTVIALQSNFPGALSFNPEPASSASKPATENLPSITLSHGATITSPFQVPSRTAGRGLKRASHRKSYKHHPEEKATLLGRAFSTISLVLMFGLSIIVMIELGTYKPVSPFEHYDPPFSKYMKAINKTN